MFARMDETAPSPWHLAIAWLVNGPREVWGRDRARVEALWHELHALGERPSRREMRHFFHERWPAQSATVTKVLLDLWAKRLRSPHHIPKSVRDERSYPWAYPFVIPELIAKKHGLPAPGTALAQRVANSSAAYLASVEAGGESETRSAEGELAASVHYLFVWGATRDRVEDAEWPATTLLVKRPSVTVLAHTTHTGQVLERARLERWRNQPPAFIRLA